MPGKEFQVISPIDSLPMATLNLSTEEEVNKMIEASAAAQKEWRKTSLKERIEFCKRFVDAFVEMKDDVALELTKQMGRPLTQTPGEVNGTRDRANYMISIAEKSLADIVIEDSDQFQRFMRREALGVVLVVGAWNYPYLISINTVIPALLAGNSLLLKQSSLTPLAAVRFDMAFKKAALPPNVFQIVHMSHEVCEKAVGHPLVAFVNFTGSVSGGHSIQKSASHKFIATGLELGGKDAAYVREDCSFEMTVEQLVDGSFYNSGQCCCAIERIYVHHSIYDRFVQAFVELTKKYVLGNPLDKETTIGPMVKASAADFVRKQIKEAVEKGAVPLIDPSHFPASKEGSAYLGPQVLVNVDHSMSVMMEESFGPVIGIMKVSSDQEAISLINDSPYGLTASIWTNDVHTAIQIGDQIETGTWFMNRCDYLDPALAWVGVKDSGRGCSLSSLAFEQLTRPKSFHLKKVQPPK